MEKDGRKGWANRIYKGVLITFILLVLLGAGVVGYGAYKYKDMVKRWHAPWNENNNDLTTEQDGKDGTPSSEKEEIEPFTMLILGVDSRGENQSRSDTIMLATVNPQKEEVLLFSIPRDTYALIPGYGYDKFNHSMFYGGPKLVKETVEAFFDIPVDYYVTVDFEGFRRAIDELGGIEIDVKKRMVYYDPTDGTSIDLHPGLQVLDGKNALDYARYRKSSIGPADSDFDRIERQHEVISALIDKGTEISSIFKVFSLMDIVGDHVKTNLSEQDIRGLYSVFRDFSSERLRKESLNGTNQRMESHGLELWFYVIDEAEKNRIHDLILSYLETKEQSE